jgi:hypothetical protein
MNKSDELKVFISSRESVCGECQEDLGTDAWIRLEPERGALCLSCADLDHLDFLPSGNMALTLRSKKYSSLYAVVLKWSRARKRYERQGLLVQPAAIEKAEEECLKDADLRERRREREAEKREYTDQEFKQAFAKRIRELYGKCPHDREHIIAQHACRKYSGRVGRSAAAKSLDERAAALAVIAHIRHAMTNYDELLSRGLERWEAREQVNEKVFEILERWKT